MNRTMFVLISKRLADIQMNWCRLKENITPVEWFLIRAAVIVGSGGFIFGYDIGVISGTLPSLKNEFHLDFYEEGVVVSILYAGSIIGCLFGGPMCDQLGRWKTIQFQNVVFVLGAILTGAATNLSMLILGRFLVGIASSISGLADVPYLTEVAPSEFRGILSGQYEMLVSAGILVSFSLDLAFSTFHGGWRFAFILPGCLALLQSWALLTLPETPKWLIGKERVPEARRALIQIYGEEVISQVDAEVKSGNIIESSDMCKLPLKHSTPPGYHTQPFNTTTADNSYSMGSQGNIEHSQSYEDVQAYRYIIQSLMYKSTSASANNSVDHPPCSRPSLSTLTSSTISIAHKQTMLSYIIGNTEEQVMISAYRYPIYVLLAIQVLSQVSGANVVRNYAPSIFEDSGLSERTALGYNILLGGVKFICTLWSVLYMETSGRKTLLQAGIALVIVGMFLLTLFPHVIEAFIVGCVLIYAGFGFGYGPVPWTLSAEVIPTMIRARVVAWALIASNLAQLVTNFAFLPMVSGMTASGTFAVFLMVNIACLIYVMLFLVETKSLQPPDILSLLHSRYVYGVNVLKCRRNEQVDWSESSRKDTMNIHVPFDLSIHNSDASNPLVMKGVVEQF